MSQELFSIMDKLFKKEPSEIIIDDIKFEKKDGVWKGKIKYGDNFLKIHIHKYDKAREPVISRLIKDKETFITQAMKQKNALDRYNDLELDKDKIKPEIYSIVYDKKLNSPDSILSYNINVILSTFTKRGQKKKISVLFGDTPFKVEGVEIV